MKPVDDQPEDVLTAVKVFGNALRVAVVRQLHSGPKQRQELVEATKATGVSVSSQLQQLQALGIVESKIISGQGRPVLYSLRANRVEQLMEALQSYCLRDR